MNCTARYATRSAGKWSASRNTAAAVAKLDMLASLALVAERNHYVRPKINEKGVINIRDGRHPVVERMIPNDMFIANDTYLDDKKDRISIITGPNMAGKSTYMRQSALIVLMAQVGSFVPASAADIGIVDRIFTRVGASDDLASGQSTFMVEMTEVANILRNATRHSLLILGRDRAGHEHLRRPEHRLGCCGAHQQHEAAGSQDPLCHPLPRADGAGRARSTTSTTTASP